MAKLAPLGPFRAFDSNGDPLNGGKLYTYEAGTTTPKTTYTDADAGTANANPVVLDANGYANVWLGDGAYKFVLKTSTDVTVWTVDDITGESSNAFGADVSTLTTSTNITDVYANSFLNCTSALTLSLLPAATAGEGFYFTVKANGADITIDPDGAELIDGAATYTVPNGSSVIVISNGTAWFTAFTPKYYDTLQTSGSSGVSIKNSGGTTVATFGSANTTNISFAGAVNVGGALNVTGAVAGSSTVSAVGSVAVAGQASGPAVLTLAEDTDNGTNKITISAPSVITADVTQSLPDKSGTFAMTSDIPTVTKWAAYTPTLVGFGTVSAQEFWWKRVDDTMFIQGRFTCGTSTATEAQLPLPNSLTTSDTVITNIRQVGNWCYAVSSAAFGTVLAETNKTYLTFGIQSGSAGGLTKQNGSGITSSGSIVSLRLEVPIKEWA